MKTEEFCISCERQFLAKEDKFGVVCRGCFTKSKRRDPLMQAAIRQTLVAVVPSVCPHVDERGHRCRMKFNVMVLNKKLEPIEITGPYTQRNATKRARRIQDQIDRKGK